MPLEIILKARANDLVVQELGKELLIYDLENHKAFCLNETSALVWQMCDGNKSVSEISQLIAKKLKSPVNNDFVWLAIDQLKVENLLEDSQEVAVDFGGLSRREVIRKAGSASMIALPLIASLIAPTAAVAQSVACVSYLGSCTLSTQCCGDAPVCSGNKCCVGTGSISPGGNYIALAGLCPASAPSFCCSGSAFRSASPDALTDICQCN